MKVIVIMNRKGGVGKTTTVCNLAYWLASEQGKRVLVVDLDGQGNATDCLRGTGRPIGKKEAEEASVVLHRKGNPTLGAAYGMEFPDMALDELVERSCISPKVYLLPGGDGLFDLGDRLERVDALKLLLHNEDNRREYDVVLIDCPPEFNIAVLNAIEASDQLIIPTTDGLASRKGAACVIEELRGGDYDVRVTVLPVMWKVKKSTGTDVQNLGRELGCEVQPIVVRWTPKAGEADRQNELLALYSGSCRASMAYRALARRLATGR